MTKLTDLMRDWELDFQTHQNHIQEILDRMGDLDNIVDRELNRYEINALENRIIQEQNRYDEAELDFLERMTDIHNNCEVSLEVTA